MSKLPRDMYKKIKVMSNEEMYGFWKRMLEEGYTQGYDAGYAEGLTADLDADELVIMDEDEARRRLTDEEFMRLIGEN